MPPATFFPWGKKITNWRSTRKNGEKAWYLNLYILYKAKISMQKNHIAACVSRRYVKWPFFCRSLFLPPFIDGRRRKNTWWEKVRRSTRKRGFTSHTILKDVIVRKKFNLCRCVLFFPSLFFGDAVDYTDWNFFGNIAEKASFFKVLSEGKAHKLVLLEEE